MAETSFGEARVAFEEGRLDDAVELLRRVLLLEPENAMVLNNMSYIMLKRGDDAGDVRPFIEQALKIDPSQPGFQNTMSILRWKEGNKEEAVRLAQQAYVGSGGEIVETRLNLLEWGGAVPTLSEKPDTQEEHQNVGEGWEDGPGEAIPRISGASEIIGADEASVNSGGAGEGEEKTVGTAGVSTSDTIPESGISE
jgi:tetratricopeptide (TPR) repeat protein